MKRKQEEQELQLKRKRREQEREYKKQQGVLARKKRQVEIKAKEKFLEGMSKKGSNASTTSKKSDRMRLERLESPRTAGEAVESFLNGAKDSQP